MTTDIYRTPAAQLACLWDISPCALSTPSAITCEWHQWKLVGLVKIMS